MPLLHPSPPPASPLGDRTPSSSSAPVMASPGRRRSPLLPSQVEGFLADVLEHGDALTAESRRRRTEELLRRCCGAPPQPPSRSLVVGDGGSDFTGDVLVAVVVAVAELSVVLRNAKRRRKTVSLGC
nr:hypothetical protein Itr_chr11CG17570 [Ipomoea trifida]